jgi:superfamily II DNA/RNA helicase
VEELQMSAPNWIIDSFGEEKIRHATEYSQELLCQNIFDKFNAKIIKTTADIPFELQEAIEIMELALIDAINREDKDLTRQYAQKAFEFLRVQELSDDANDKMKHIIKCACFGIIGEKNADVRRWLKEEAHFPDERNDYSNWAEQVFFETSIAFLLSIRKNTWVDLEHSTKIIVQLRESQLKYERDYLVEEGLNKDLAGFELVSLYHLAKSIDLLTIFFRKGENQIKTLQDINFHLDRSIESAEKARIAELGLLIFWMRNAIQLMVKNSIWWVLLSINSNITQFVKQLTAQSNEKPIFELWPPQSRALLDEGLLDPAKRAVVIQMPTSSGKTLLAEFRILQTKQLFPDSWIAYIVPTRSLVNQITNRLREDLSPLNLVIEQAVPAFELDPIEEELLTGSECFDVLVTTQEKLDLLIRSDKLNNGSRNLGLVIVDEAHNIKSKGRGLKTEMLLTIINREFDNVQFLLLSPFVPNIEDLANWLDSERSAKISIKWRPNEQMVGVVFPEGRGKDWELKLRSLYTSHETISIKNDVVFEKSNPYDKIKSQITKAEISAIVASELSKRNGVIVIAVKKNYVMQIARRIFGLLPPEESLPDEIRLVQKYIASEYGEDYLLHTLLGKRVAFHHAGVSPELRYLLEWLMEKGHLKAMVATTTLAQGVNFPISSIVINEYKVGIPPKKMSMDDFWNIAGRAGRADQDTLGIVAFISSTGKYDEIEQYVKNQVSELVSHLETLVMQAVGRGEALNFKELVRNDPEWSNFIQYLCHTYRQIGDHSRFVTETETIIKATYGYQRIHKINPDIAKSLVTATVDYAKEIQKIDKQTLSLVDQTGFSPDSIRELRANTRDLHLNVRDLSASGIFNTQNRVLAQIMGSLLKVSELNIETKRGQVPGDQLAQIISKWVSGERISKIAKLSIFENDDQNATQSINDCIIALNNIVTFSSWGMGAIESLAIKKEDIEKLSKREQYEIRSVPAMIYFGVDTLEGVVMRNIGVPRSIAKKMGESFKQSTGDEIPTITRARNWLKEFEFKAWDECRPQDSDLSGEDYRKIWQISNGQYRGT